MTVPDSPRPSAEPDPQDASTLRLHGRWTLEHALAIGQALRGAPDSVGRIDATAVDRLDSVGVLQLLRYARRRELAFDGLNIGMRTIADRLFWPHVMWAGASPPAARRL